MHTAVLSLSAVITEKSTMATCSVLESVKSVALVFVIVGLVVVIDES